MKLTEKQKRAFNSVAPGTYGDARLGETLDTAARRTNIKQKLIAAGAAGNHTVTGIEVGDEIISVTNFDADGTSVNDLTSEFTVTAASTINNTGGTATDGKLQILYLDLT